MTTPSSTRFRWKSLVTAALLVVVALPMVIPSAAAAPRKGRFERVGGLRLLGQLPEPHENGITFRYVIQVDPENRILYYLYIKGASIFIREYDLRPEIPEVLRETMIGTTTDVPISYASPYTIQLDKKNGRLLILANGFAGSLVRILDLETFEVEATWDLQAVVPGFVGQGMTVSDEDHRIYVVGSQSVNAVGTTNAVVNKPAQAAMVLALENAGGPDTPSLAWAKPIPQCQQVMDTFTIGALIARSLHQQALYFACVRTDPWPGESGVVRLGLTPKGTRQDAFDFPVDFFPVSGAYDGNGGILGIAAFDYASDRLFLQSLAFSTPGAWVFDARLSAWGGFIAAPDSSDRYMGLDQSTGHYYLAGSEHGISTKYKGAYILVSDGRATPVPQGTVYRGLGTTGFIVTDPVTHRLFAPMVLSKVGFPAETEVESGYVVLKDESPIVQPPAPPDYDALTSNVPEGPKTLTNYSGGVNGFGARAVLVGGYGGALSASGRPVTVDRLRSGDRGFTAARVSSIDLRNAGASATAQPFLSDSNTDAELTDAGAGAWPWAPASCLDGGGQALDAASTGPGGSSTVICDLEKQRSEASSSFGLLEADGISIAKSTFHAAAWRDAKKGVVTQTVASAEGIELPAADGGSVAIARVEATATTSAHGLPKTAEALWQRSISGAEIRDAEGKVTQRLAGCAESDDGDQCQALIDQINDTLETKLRLSLPEPDVVATPKGAFATVRQTDRDYLEGKTVNNQGTTFSAEAASRALPALQLTVYNDSMEKSRLLVQLAALQANSIYTNSQADAYVEPPTDTVPQEPPSSNTAPSGQTAPVDQNAGTFTGGGGDAPVAASDPQAQPAAAPVVAEGVEGVLAFLRRGPKEMLLFAGFWMLFAGAGTAIMRRRSLLGVLSGVSAR